MAQTVNFLPNITYWTIQSWKKKRVAATAHHNELSAQIKATEKRMAEIAVLRTHIVNYAKTRETYVAYRKAVIPENFGRNMSKKFCSIRRQKMPLMRWE